MVWLRTGDGVVDGRPSSSSSSFGIHHGEVGRLPLPSSSCPLLNECWLGEAGWKIEGEERPGLPPRLLLRLLSCGEVNGRASAA